MAFTVLGLILLGFILDALLGDFWGRWHPVCLIGKLIGFFERLVQKIVGLTHGKIRPLIAAAKVDEKTGERYFAVLVKYLELFLGGLLAVLVIGIVAYVSFLVANLHILIELLMIHAAIAYKSLIDHLKAVMTPLKAGDTPRARQALAMIVGRDTEQLSQGEISRAGVETGAESMADGVIAPLFYGVIGGAPLMMAYKAVNTLDSMVGYPFPPYHNIGYISAKLDDLLNIVPARLTALLLLTAGKLSNLNVSKGWQCLWADAGKHPSPNAGRPEATLAGLLNVRLGGRNTYQGEVSFRAHLNAQGNFPEPAAVEHTIQMIKYTAWLGITVLLIFGFCLRWFMWLNFS